MQRAAWAVLIAAAVACGGSGNGGKGNIGAGGDGGSVAEAGSDAGSSGSDAGTAVDAGQTGAASDIVAISLSQTNVYIAAGANTAFAVTGTQRDGTRVDLTPQAQAVSSNTAVATVQNGPGSQIQIRAVAAGSASITVTYASFQQTCAVTVSR